MKKLGALGLILLVVSWISGCGGNGSDVSGQTDQALVNSLDRAAHDINTENLSDLDNIDLASDFFDECQTRSEFLDTLDAIFSEPGRDFTFTVDRIIDVTRTSSVEGTVTYDWTVDDSANGITHGTDTDFFEREGGEWRWAGNQVCPAAVASRTATKKAWRIGK